MAKTFHSHPAHPPPVHRHNTPVLLHVTVGTKNRASVLATDEAHVAMVQGWREATHWLVGRYVVMPDHVHFFCSPGIHEYPGIRRWTGYWKRLIGNTEPCLKHRFAKDCWDTQMRTLEHYDEKLAYTLANPVRQGLVKAPEDWPYQGRVHDIGWR